MSGGRRLRKIKSALVARYFDERVRVCFWQYFAAHLAAGNDDDDAINVAQIEPPTAVSESVRTRLYIFCINVVQPERERKKRTKSIGVFTNGAIKPLTRAIPICKQTKKYYGSRKTAFICSPGSLFPEFAAPGGYAAQALSRKTHFAPNERERNGRKAIFLFENYGLNYAAHYVKVSPLSLVEKTLRLSKKVGVCRGLLKTWKQL